MMSNASFFGRALLGIMVGVAAIFGLGFWLDSIGCQNQLDGLRSPGYYRMLGGCFAEMKDGRYIPLDRYIGMQGVELK